MRFRHCGRWGSDRRSRALDRALLDLALVHRLVDPLQRPRLVEAGRDDADLHVLSHAVVDDRAEDDVRLRVGGGVDDLSRLVDFEQRKVRTAGDGEQHATRAVDGLLEKWRLDRLARGIRGARLTCAVSDAHQRGARVGHDRLHVGEVEVDEAGHRDEVTDALDALAQNIVDDAESVDHAGALLDDLKETVVRDRDQRVDLVDEIRDPLLREESALRALEGEWLRDHSHGERADVLGDLGDDRSAAGPRSAAHTGGNEDHVGFLERLVELLAVVLGCLAPNTGIGAGAEALGDFIADADLVRCVREKQRLSVGIHRDELDAHELRSDHAIDGVRAAAADTNDLYESEIFDVAPEGHGHTPNQFPAAAPPLTAPARNS